MFHDRLKQLKDKNRYRSLVLSGGIDLSSNDYLGLQEHPAIRSAAREAIDNGMVLGSGGSRLLRGHHAEHEALEAFAARHYGSEKALYMANGFVANYALFSTLLDRHSTVIYDELLHASALDGIHASHAKRMKFAHNDLQHCEDALKRADGAKWVAVESVYSMDGDAAPLQELQQLCARYDAMLIVDEAHGSGVCGENGKGLSAGLVQQNLITMHTCGKALGGAGGLLCASVEIVDYMVNAARPFVYSTAPPPLQAHLTQKAIELVASAEGDQQRQSLSRICDHVTTQLAGMGIDVPKIDGNASHIAPIIVGDDKRAVEIAAILQEAGYDIRAIRPPTVPEGTARLRMSLNAKLSAEQLEPFFELLQQNLERKRAA